MFSDRLRDSLTRLRGSTNIGLNPSIFRRSYSVPGPNFLWHLDGNHKLTHAFTRSILLGIPCLLIRVMWIATVMELITILTPSLMKMIQKLLLSLKLILPSQMQV